MMSIRDWRRWMMEKCCGNCRMFDKEIDGFVKTALIKEKESVKL